MSERFNQWWDECGQWSVETFGDGYRGESVLKHIEKEIAECREDMARQGAMTASLEEWADIAQLAMDGARRAGVTADEFIEQLFKKLEINRPRTWICGEDGVCEHERSARTAP